MPFFVGGVPCLALPQIITALTGMKDSYSTTATEQSIHDPTFGGSNVFASKSHPFITSARARCLSLPPCGISP